MIDSTTELVTPIYVKTHRQMPRPAKDQMFYLLTANGLFICRNHPFFQSCVPAGSGPAELAGQETYVDFNYPKIPRRLLELTVGFFTQIGRNYHAEAIVVILWDTRNQKFTLIVPRQKARIYHGNYGTCPLGVEYEVPVHLPEDHIILGDIHSHVGMAAFSSDTDKRDEKKRPGLHIVVGRIHREPPEFLAELIVDGLRFKVEPNLVLEDYYQRARISTKYVKQVEIETSYACQGNWNKPGTKENHYDPPRGGCGAKDAVSNEEFMRIE